MEGPERCGARNDQGAPCIWHLGHDGQHTAFESNQEWARRCVRCFDGEEAAPCSCSKPIKCEAEHPGGSACTLAYGHTMRHANAAGLFWHDAAET